MTEPFKERVEFPLECSECDSTKPWGSEPFVVNFYSQAKRDAARVTLRHKPDGTHDLVLSYEEIRTLL